PGVALVDLATSATTTEFLMRAVIWGRLTSSGGFLGTRQSGTGGRLTDGGAGPRCHVPTTGLRCFRDGSSAKGGGSYAPAALAPRRREAAPNRPQGAMTVGPDEATAGSIPGVGFRGGQRTTLRIAAACVGLGVLCPLAQASPPGGCLSLGTLGYR